MCWNWGVSISFAVGLALGSAYLFFRRRLKLRGFNRDPYEALIVLNLAFVQFWEFLMWLVVYPDDADPRQCPLSNTVFTAFVYFHGVTLWGVLIPFFCYKTTEGPKDVYRFPFFFGIIYFLLVILDLVYSSIKIPDEYTCATDGQVFLKWNIALSESRLLPGGFDWFLFSVLPFIFYKPLYIGGTIALWLLLTFALPIVFVEIGEAASVFWWLGFGLFIIFVIEPFILTFGEKCTPRLANFMSKVNRKVEQVRDRILFPNIRNVNENVDSESKTSGTEMSEKSQREKIISLESLVVSETKKDASNVKKVSKDDDSASTASTESKSDSDV